VAQAERDEKAAATIVYCLHGYTYELSPTVYPAGVLTGATRANFIAGKGLTCERPEGYTRRGFATVADGVRPRTYPYYGP
jgi:hypothetical protein